MAHISFISLITLYIISLLSYYTLLLAFSTIIPSFLCYLHSYNSISPHLLFSLSSIHTVTFWKILNIIHFIHTVCLNWLYRIVSFMVINQFFINISCTNTQLQPNPLCGILVWFICIVCYYILTITYFHHIQCHCIHISL